MTQTPTRMPNQLPEVESPESPGDTDRHAPLTSPDSTDNGRRLVRGLIAIPILSLGRRLTPSETGRARLLRLTRRYWLTIASLVVAVAWFVVFRPAMWGGPVGYDIVAGVGMEPALHQGDLVLSSVQSSYSVDDLVSYHVPAGNPAAGSVVIHRVTGGDAVSGFITKGDDSALADPWHPTAAQIAGKVWIDLPGIGSILLALKAPPVLALVLGTLAGLWWFFTFGRSRGAGGEKRGRRLIGMPIQRRVLQPVRMDLPTQEPTEHVATDVSDTLSG